MTLHNMIRDRIAETVPFARHVGVHVFSVDDGQGGARLEQTETSINHIGTQHAGAIFRLGEATSGAAMAGAFAEQILSIRPIAKAAQIAFKAAAKGGLEAAAHTLRPADELRASLAADGRVEFDVAVTIRDQSGLEVASMTVAWHVRGRAPEPA